MVASRLVSLEMKSKQAWLSLFLSPAIFPKTVLGMYKAWWGLSFLCFNFHVFQNTGILMFMWHHIIGGSYHLFGAISQYRQASRKKICLKFNLILFIWQLKKAPVVTAKTVEFPVGLKEDKSWLVTVKKKAAIFKDHKEAEPVMSKMCFRLTY